MNIIKDLELPKGGSYASLAPVDSPALVKAGDGALLGSSLMLVVGGSAEGRFLPSPYTGEGGWVAATGVPHPVGHRGCRG